MTGNGLWRRGGLLALISVLGYGAFSHWHGQNEVQQKKEKRAVVESALVQEGEISDPLLLTGSLQANQSVAMTPEVSGRIISLPTAKQSEVQKGELVVGLDDAHQRATVAESEAFLRNEQRKLQYMERLSVKGVVTEDQRQGQEAVVAQARARLDMALYELGQRHLTAPFAGSLSLHDLSLGAWVTPGQLLLHLDDLSRMRLDLAVPERFFGQLQPGLTIHATSVARPGERFTGHVEVLDSRIDGAAGSFKVRVLFDNPQRKLRAGMLMQVELALDGERYPLIPAQAIEYRGEERFVYRIDQQGVAHRVSVQLGHALGEQVAVLSGIKAGDRIVVAGLVQLKDGQKIRDMATARVAP